MRELCRNADQGEVVAHPVHDEPRIEICFGGQYLDVFVSEVLGTISTNEGDQVEIALDNLLARSTGRQSNRVSPDRQVVESDL